MIASTTHPRITFDCIIFGLQRFGGISNYWDRLTTHAMASGRLDVEMILPKKMISAAMVQRRFDGVKAVHEMLPTKLSRYLPAHSSSGSVFHTSYYRLPRGRVGKYVVTVYDFIYERYRSGLPQWAHSLQKLASIRRADEIICISEYTRRDVLEFCPKVDAARVHTVPLAVEHEVFFPETSRALDSLGCEVLFVGQRGGYKRFELAVEALRQSPELRLGIVGSALTPQEQALLAYRLGSRWTYHGLVTTQQLRALYAQAFAFVFPSDYEGFGLPVLEAMACGCPVVSSCAASLPEVGGTAALYASEQSAESYAQAFATLLLPGVREHRVGAGLSRSQEFSWARTCDQTLSIYSS